MFERLLRWGCWLNGHALIRREEHRATIACRCGQRAMTHRLYLALYADPLEPRLSPPDFQAKARALLGWDAEMRRLTP